MLNRSQLNVYIVGASLSPRLRQRLQAQLQTALRSLPDWSFSLLSRRLEELGAASFPLIVEPQPEERGNPQALSLGEMEGRPAVRLLPRLRGDPSTGLRTGEIDWLQDRRYLLAKAVAYLAAPSRSDTAFWWRWAGAVDDDGLRQKARRGAEHWAAASDLDLFLEMSAAYALNPEHSRWAELAAVRAFLEERRRGAG